MVLRHGTCTETVEGANVCTNSLNEAVAFKPDIAIIASPATSHAEQAIALAGAGTHLLVEKPMASNTLEARAMLSAANAAGVMLQVGYNLRFQESLSALRAALVAGRIGRVASVRAEVGQYLPDWRPGRDWRNSVSARSDLGGGALLELSHELDFLYWIFGDVKALRGWLGRQGGFGLEVEDTVHALLEFANTFPAGGKGVAPVASVSLDFIRRDTVRRCVVIGEDGTLSWDGVSSSVMLMRPGENSIVLHETKPERDASYKAQLNAFLSAVETGIPIGASAADGVAVMKIIEALRGSHDGGGAVKSPGNVE
jgi:predicted dehydrogenase